MIAADVLKLIWNHPANRNRRPQALARGISWQLYKRLTGKTWTIPVFENLRMKCYPDSLGAGLMIYTSGMPDYDDIQFTAAYLRPGESFLDVGANIGIYTLLAASTVGNHGRVVSVEAGQTAFERLVENVQLNGFHHVETHFAAVGEREGSVKFLQGRDLVNRLALDDLEHEADAESVPSVTIDGLIGNASFAMGKIDIEGAEPIAFRGATESLKAGNPRVWLLELKDRLLKKYGFSAVELAEFLRGHGYQLGSYDADRATLSMDNQPWDGRENVIAVHESALDDVYERLRSRRADPVR